MNMQSLALSVPDIGFPPAVYLCPKKLAVWSRYQN